MTLYQMTVTRALTVYVAQGLICVFFIFLAYKILKRDRKRLNIIFSGFYLSAAVGLFVNFIYAPLDPLDFESVILFLNYITNFGIFYSPIFLVVFNSCNCSRIDAFWAEDDEPSMSTSNKSQACFVSSSEKFGPLLATEQVKPMRLSPECSSLISAASLAIISTLCKLVPLTMSIYWIRNQSQAPKAS